MSDRLVLRLVADANSKLKGLDDVQRNLDQFMTSVESAGVSLGSGLNNALKTRAAIASGGNQFMMGHVVIIADM
jgi:hypothetical protein